MKYYACTRVKVIEMNKTLFTATHITPLDHGVKVGQLHKTAIKLANKDTTINRILTNMNNTFYNVPGAVVGIDENTGHLYAQKLIANQPAVAIVTH